MKPGTSLMMMQKEFSFNIGREITQPLLCNDCEGLLSKGGENYFAKVGMPLMGDKMPPLLFRVLKSSLIPLWNRFGARVNPNGKFAFGLGAEMIPVLNQKDIYYFAISMFWRGGVDGWKNFNKLNYEEGLMESMRKFLLGGENVPGYVVKVLPSFWAEKYGAVLPLNIKGVPFFSIHMYDFYLEKSDGNSNARKIIPMIYVADSFRSVETHDAMVMMINDKSARARNLKKEGDLVSWGRNKNSSEL